MPSLFVRLLFGVSLLLGTPLAVSAEQISLAWDASPTPTVTGYQIVYGLVSLQYVASIDVGDVLTARLDLPAGAVYFVSVRAYDSGGRFSEPANEVVISTVPSLPPDIESSAQFIGIDSTTRGDWPGTYGRVGALVAGDASTMPPSVGVSTSGSGSWVWDPAPSSTRALRRTSDAGRIAATWYAGTDFSIDVALPPQQQYVVALYVVDWDDQGRVQQIQPTDAATGTVLDTRTIGGFTGGQFVTWSVRGHVTFRVINSGPVNAVVSGVFLDPVGGSSSNNAARFVDVDRITAGTWRGVYGTEGHALAGDEAAFPSHISVTQGDALSWTWDGAPTRVEALQRGTGPGRIAATWYSGTSFSIDVRTMDGREHRVALYSIDWDSLGRFQRIEAIDPVTGALLDAREFDDFAEGQYAIWTVQGTVRFRLVNLGSPNAVVSGVFIDPAS